MNPVPSIPAVPVLSDVQPVASNPIISAIVSVASGCSRFCGLTDLSQAISLIRQGEYVQASGKALEGALRVGVLVAVAGCVIELGRRERELGRMEHEIDGLSDRLAQEEGLRKAEVLKVQKELNMQREALKNCKIELTNCKTDVENTNGYLSECDQKRANFQGDAIKLKKELTDLKVELEKRKASASLCETAHWWNPLAAAPTVVIKNEEGGTNKKAQDLQAQLNNKIDEIQQLRDTLAAERAMAARKTAGPTETVVPPLTSERLKALYDQSPSATKWNFDAKNFLCRDVPGVPMDCGTKKEIRDAFKFSSRRCHPDKFAKAEDRKMADHLQKLLLEAREKLIDRATG